MIEDIAQEFEPGTLIASRYEVVKFLGTGASGWVIEAKDTEIESQSVALKLMYPHLFSDEDSYKKFTNEIILTRKLSHPNIVQTYNSGKTESDISYISMEYIEGITLKEFLEEKKPFDLEQSIDLIYQIARGIYYAHCQGIIHKDLKPDNIFVCSDFSLKILDFGISELRQVEGKSNRARGKIAGTPHYMSPEQLKAEFVDERSDIYSLGILFYEILTGNRPFQANSFYELAQQHLQTQIPSLDESNDIPKWLSELITKCCAKKPNARVQSARQICKIIEENHQSIRPDEDLENSKISVQEDGSEDGIWEPELLGEETQLLKLVNILLSSGIIICLLYACFGNQVTGIVFAVYGALLFPFARLRKELRYLALSIWLSIGMTVIFGQNPALKKRMTSWVIRAENATPPIYHFVPASIRKLCNLFPPKGTTVLEAAEHTAAGSWNGHGLWAVAHSGLPLNLKNKDGLTALHLFAAAEEHGALKTMRRAGADFNVRDKDGNTPLMYAIKKSCHRCTMKILGNDEIDATNNTGETALIWAIQLGNTDSVKRLINAGANIDLANPKTGDTPVHLAAKLQLFNLLQTLINLGGNPKTLNKNNETTLHLATTADRTAGSSLKIIQLLLNQGVDPNIRNHKGQTALDIAQQQQHLEAASLIETFMEGSQN